MHIINIAYQCIARSGKGFISFARQYIFESFMEMKMERKELADEIIEGRILRQGGILAEEVLHAFANASVHTRVREAYVSSDEDSLD